MALIRHVSLAFLISLGAGTVIDSAAAAELCNNGNIDATLNDPSRDFTPCTFEGPAHITEIMTYHWNSGRGAEGGTIALRNVDTGRLYGPFRVRTTPGQGGVPDAYWHAYIDIVVPAGEYRVIDSDVRTWSWNAASQGYGIVTIAGEYLGDDDRDDGHRHHHDDRDGGDRR